jgi:hypothetical protein
MTIETTRNVLLVSGIINYVILILWVLLFLFARDFVHWFGRLFRVPAEPFDAMQYGGIVLYKLGILLFNLGPCLALYIVG